MGFGIWGADTPLDRRTRCQVSFLSLLEQSFNASLVLRGRR